MARRARCARYRLKRPDIASDKAQQYQAASMTPLLLAPTAHQRLSDRVLGGVQLCVPRSNAGWTKRTAVVAVLSDQAEQSLDVAASCTASAHMGQASRDFEPLRTRLLRAAISSSGEGLPLLHRTLKMSCAPTCTATLRLMLNPNARMSIMLAGQMDTFTRCESAGVCASSRRARVGSTCAR